MPYRTIRQTDVRYTITQTEAHETYDPVQSYVYPSTPHADYDAMLDDLERRHTPPGHWSCRVWLLVTAMLATYALTVPVGQTVGLLIVAFALLLWGLVPHARPGGDPLPPSMVPAVPDPDTERIRLASNVCWWAGIVGNVPALMGAAYPLEKEWQRRQRALHPEWPRPRYWLRVLVAFLVMTGLMVWGLAVLIAQAPPLP
jgi:hypothetical protein